MKISVQSNIPKLEAQIKAYKPLGFTAYRDDIEAARQEQIKSNFANESDSNGNKWPGLAASTIKERERLNLGGAHPILYRLGGLEQAAINAQITTTDTNFFATIAEANLAKIGGILNVKRNFFFMGITFSAKITEVMAQQEASNIQSTLTI